MKRTATFAEGPVHTNKSACSDTANENRKGRNDELGEGPKSGSKARKGSAKKRSQTRDG